MGILLRRMRSIRITSLSSASGQATSVSCSESGAYTVVNNVDSPSKCSDQGQPYVLLQQHGVADQVLCLKPAH